MERMEIVEGLAAECGGTVAVAAVHLRSGQRLEREARRSYPSASIIKVPILAALHAEAEAGRLSWQERVTLTEAAKVPGSGVLRELHDGLELTLEDLARLMIVVSDNTATNLLIDRIGTGPVNALMASLGFEVTRLGRRMYDFAARDRGLENRCAAGEITELLVRLERRELVSPAASEAMLAVMKRQAHTEKIPRLLPPGTVVANKTGSITGVSHDMGLIYAPGGPIALTVLTEGARNPVAAEETVARIARAVFDAWSDPARETPLNRE
jgi:beta-lactamase class A